MNRSNQLDGWKLAHAYRRIGSGATPASGDERYYTEEGGAPWITTAELRESYVASTAVQVTEEALREHSGLRVYQPNSVFMALYGATIGRLGMNTVPATCNQACCVFERSEVFDNRFLYYWLWHRRSDLIALSTGGGQPNLSQQDLRSEIALCPPLKTQKRIAAFLDKKTAKIDALIAKKQALLDRLAEKRQAIITQAVTKGLNPAAPMKDSGIDWLGQIPAHWAVRRLRFLLNGRTINGIYKPKDQFTDEGVPFVQMGEAFRATVFQPGTKDRVSTTRDEIEKWGLRKGDFLIARRSLVFEGSGKSVKIGDLPEDHLFESSMIRIRPVSPELISDFLSYCFQSEFSRSSILSITKQVTISGIDSQQLKDIVVPVPPSQEACEIARCCADFDESNILTRNKIAGSMEKLEEYRASLITAAVSGKIESLN